MSKVLKINQPAMPKVAKDEDELFPVGHYKVWKKGEITNPTWLKKENGYDFIAIKTEKDFERFAAYMAADDERLCVAFYNAFSTGRDKLGSPMIFLLDMDDSGESVRRSVIVITEPSLAMRVMELVEFYVGEASDVD